jgi:hypothetical protein
MEFKTESRLLRVRVFILWVGNKFISINSSATIAITNIGSDRIKVIRTSSDQ